MMDMNIINMLSALPLTTVYVLAGTGLLATTITSVSLSKASKYSGKIIIEKPPVIKFFNSENRRKIDQEMAKTSKNILSQLTEVLKNNLKESNLNILYNNLQTLKMKKAPIFLFLTCRKGGYAPSINTMFYGDRSIGHETIHLSSSIYDHENDIILSGFAQIKDNYSIAHQLTEGYTSLLDARFFHNKEKVKSYKDNAKLAKLIELFFDNPKEMEDLFFNCNLPGLIHHMMRYAPKDKIVKLLTVTDKVVNANDPTAKVLNFASKFISIKSQMELYNWFKAKNKDPNKLKQFTDIMCEGKLIKLIMNNKFKLQHEQLNNNLREGKVM